MKYIPLLILLASCTMKQDYKCTCMNSQGVVVSSDDYREKDYFIVEGKCKKKERNGLTCYAYNN